MMSESPDIRSLELSCGIKIDRFRSPSSPEGERWRVVMPHWAKGTWLDGNYYWFPTMQDALDSLTETGTIVACETWWEAQMQEQRARQEFFSKATSAHGKACRQIA